MPVIVSRRGGTVALRSLGVSAHHVSCILVLIYVGLRLWIAAMVRALLCRLPLAIQCWCSFQRAQSPRTAPPSPRRIAFTCVAFLTMLVLPRYRLCGLSCLQPFAVPVPFVLIVHRGCGSSECFPVDCTSFSRVRSYAWQAAPFGPCIHCWHCLGVALLIRGLNKMAGRLASPSTRLPLGLVCWAASCPGLLAPLVPGCSPSPVPLSKNKNKNSY